MPDPTVWHCVDHLGEHTVPSRRDPGKVYVVTFYENGDVWCTCPSMKFQRTQRITCKHIDEVMERICGWDQAVHGEEPSWGSLMRCPVCHGPVASSSSTAAV